MPQHEIDPRDLTPGMIGQLVRVTWPGAASGRTAVIEGALDGINHGTRGTSIEVDLGVTHLRLDAQQLQNAIVERP